MTWIEITRGVILRAASPVRAPNPEPSRPMRKSQLGHRLVGPALVLCALVACAPKKDEKPRPAPEAGYVVLASQTVPLEIELTGRTVAFEMSDVRPQVAGLILDRTFTEGSIVHKGQVLYRIDPAQYRAVLAQAQANLASAEANAATTRAKADRYKPLAAMQAVATQDYVDAKGAAEQAAAGVAQARAAVTAARINLGFTSIPAPIGGRIGRSLVTTGGLVTVGQTTALTTIQRLDPIFVDIQQSSADLLALRRALASGGRTPSSATVHLAFGDGTVYGKVGHVEFAEAMVDPATGTVTLRARFANPAGVLLPGMFVRARLSQQTATNAILAPIAGIARDPRGNATALVVARDDPDRQGGAGGNKNGGDKSGAGKGGGKPPPRTGFTAVSREVVVDRTVGDKWLVTNGLNAGDRLIVEGLGKIKPGQPIRPVVAGSPAPKGDGKTADAAAK